MTETKNFALPESAMITMATLSDTDKTFIRQRCRSLHNGLGLGYQLMFAKVWNRLPRQIPFEIHTQLLAFAALQLEIPEDNICAYQKRQQTLSEHHGHIRIYLKLARFDQDAIDHLSTFLFNEAQRIEHRTILLAKAEGFLKENGILQSPLDTLERLIVTQRQKARDFIHTQMHAALTSAQCVALDDLLKVEEAPYSPLQKLKQPPALPSPKALVALTEKLDRIREIGIDTLDISWINNNYQRILTKYATRCSASRLKKLKPTHRYTVLICFLKQLSLDTIDHVIDMHHKLMLKVCRRAHHQMDDSVHKQRQHFKTGQIMLATIVHILRDTKVQDPQVRAAIFKKFSETVLATHVEEGEPWLTGKLSHIFHLVVKRAGYIRQFSPSLLAHLTLEGKSERAKSVMKAAQLLNELNQNNKRTLPDDVPLDFIPKKMRPCVVVQGVVNKQAWECAVLVALRDEIKVGNLVVQQSKRFGSFDHFFMPNDAWQKERSAFFKRSGLPEQPEEARIHLTQRLDHAFETFLAQEKDNKYAQVKDGQWVLSVDAAEQLTAKEEESLQTLRDLLKKHMRTIKLPALLIEVDNDLHFTTPFMLPHQQSERHPDDVCAILATIMAHGCFIGTYTMARLTQDVSYERIRRITDWQLTEEAQREALACVVNAISHLDVSKQWGAGKTSSSDGQRFQYTRHTLQQTYSTRFRDFALEFYTFVADNYAPYFSVPHECAERDSPYVLDGILYNESELMIEEHYVDSHGYTEINFAAFGMLGKTLSPRIRDIKDQRIYKIDTAKSYGNLDALVPSHHKNAQKNRVIRMDWILEQWDKMGQFYASLASGHATASTALKRLTGFSPKHHFYRANRELGRIFKTENILTYMADPLLRQNRRRGLLKGEQIHQLARDVGYGKRGNISARDVQAQRNTCSCLTLIMACIIYWQAKEIAKIIEIHGKDWDPEILKMLPHVSPIGWDNVILYGEYVLDRGAVQ